MAAFPETEERFEIEPGCSRCPELARSRGRIAWGNGPLDADLVVVGEAPAAGDPGADRWRGGNLTGLAYTSQHSGRRIRELLTDAGFDSEACFFTNAIKCHPTDVDGEPREPTSTELSTCRGHLQAEVATVSPRAVVPTGRHATASVLAMDGVELDGFLERVLEPIESAALGTSVVPLLHPSYQDVWIPRLGLEPQTYRERLRETLASV